eukprot:TRINITY_DN2106_c0_g2_i1.p1 TRINITY_DN2106_c0_g2~~TRINITY_DN2106_c0_g2_i1.p1  ORF type:complete len:357 (+),score=57.23 TRINITY_DN2106_c0_g2_i1:142-1212(+)
MSQLIECIPGNAVFSYDERNEVLRASIVLKNLSIGYVGYKLKSTNPARYDVQPDGIGQIERRGQQEILLYMKVDQGQTINTYKDKILIQAIQLEEGQKSERHLFSRSVHPEMQSTYLRVAIDAPSREGMEEITNNDQQHIINMPPQPASSVGSANPAPAALPAKEEEDDYVAIEEEDTNALEVYPLELFLDMRQGQGKARSVLSLYNDSRLAIAYKVKSTNATRYVIHPGPTGVVKQNSSQELIISVSGEAKFPEEVQFIPEEVIVQSFVLLQSVRVSPQMFKQPENCPGFKQQTIPFSININEDILGTEKNGASAKIRAMQRRKCVIISSIIALLVIIIIAVLVVVLYVMKIIQV